MFSVGDIVEPKNPREFRDYWGRHSDAEGDTDSAIYTIVESLHNQGVRLKELSFDKQQGWFIPNWFQLVPEEELPKKEEKDLPKLEEYAKIVGTHNIPMGRIAKVHDALYVARFAHNEVLRIWPNEKSCQVESLPITHDNTWHMELLPINTTLTLVFQGDKNGTQV
jgi:hypothetical protein